ncbi:MAG: hypothetical protein IJM17_06290, partial [Firmicutes bacterium]|nr:hypothetical protein [Bacillota bacterium]
VEQGTENPRVTGSIPVLGTTKARLPSFGSLELYVFLLIAAAREDAKAAADTPIKRVIDMGCAFRYTLTKLRRRRTEAFEHIAADMFGSFRYNKI